MKTYRGFEVKHFKDDYGMDCSIQESSSLEPHIWLGIHNPQVKIMYKDVNIIKTMKIEKDYPETGDGGWCTLNMPEECLIDSRMHLNVEQAKWLIDELKYFVRHKQLKTEEEL